MRNAIRCCIACILPCGALDVIRIVHSNVPPDAELQRGKIYFLMPMPSSCSSPSSSSSAPPREKSRTTRPRSSTRNKKKMRQVSSEGQENGDNANLLASDDQYLTEIMSEKVSSTQKYKRRGRVGVWRPHLESISEIVSES
ncbi:hypothetical protein HAX54_000090 [Datura stramonium]|uniref:Uncharacterized protein n=1 Tax=Datura stramonium TaxID=4076 RepID=A0ABS8RI56_DATST|nr:hypothetical protein [Datura stramonium]